VKIADFGLARICGTPDSFPAKVMTDYAASRWYRYDGSLILRKIKVTLLTSFRRQRFISFSYSFHD
jgi:hypothetical protein